MADAECARSEEEGAGLFLARAAAASVVGVPFALIVLAACGLPDFLAAFIGLLILLFWVIAGIGALIATVRSAMRKAWRRCLLTAILPVTLLLIALNPLGYVRACFHIGDAARFIALKPSYDRTISALPANQRPGLVVFVWDGFLGTSHGVVYDESDQIALPPRQQSVAWLAKIKTTELACGSDADPLWDHYYLAVFYC